MAPLSRRVMQQQQQHRRSRRSSWMAAVAFVGLASLGRVQALSSSSTTITSPARKLGKQIVETKQVPGLEKGMDYVQLGDSNLVVSNVCMG